MPHELHSEAVVSVHAGVGWWHVGKTGILYSSLNRRKRFGLSDAFSGGVVLSKQIIPHQNVPGGLTSLE